MKFELACNRRQSLCTIPISKHLHVPDFICIKFALLLALGFSFPVA